MLYIGGGGAGRKSGDGEREGLSDSNECLDVPGV